MLISQLIVNLPFFVYRGLVYSVVTHAEKEVDNIYFNYSMRIDFKNRLSKLKDSGVLFDS